MKESIKTRLKTAGLVALVGVGFVPLPVPKNWVDYSGKGIQLAKRWIIDENHDGEADKTFTVFVGSRIPYMAYVNATQEEKDFYREHKRE